MIRHKLPTDRPATIDDIPRINGRPAVDELNIDDLDIEASNRTLAEVAERWRIRDEEAAREREQKK